MGWRGKSLIFHYSSTLLPLTVRDLAAGINFSVASLLSALSNYIPFINQLLNQSSALSPFETFLHVHSRVLYAYAQDYSPEAFWVLLFLRSSVVVFLAFVAVVVSVLFAGVGGGGGGGSSKAYLRLNKQLPNISMITSFFSFFFSD